MFDDAEKRLLEARKNKREFPALHVNGKALTAIQFADTISKINAWGSAHLLGDNLLGSAMLSYDPILERYLYVVEDETEEHWTTRDWQRAFFMSKILDQSF